MANETKVPTVETVEVEAFRKNERWYGFYFRVAKRGATRLQVYGATSFLAEKRLFEALDFDLGALNYQIKKVEKLSGDTPQ